MFFCRIVSNWNREGDKLTMDIMILVNTTATVFLPTKNEKEVAESAKPISKAKGIKFLRMENDSALYLVESGSYHFQTNLKML